MRILTPFRKFTAAVVFLTAATLTAAAQDALLIVAHGARQPEWNERVIRLAEKVDWPGPVGVAFLMNAAPEHRLDRVAARLDATGAERIIVLPLLVSSFSGHYEEIRYYVGERSEAPHHAHYQPLRTRAQLVLAPAMDDHEVITRILADQVRAISVNPAEESLVLVAHGPNEDSDNRLWLERLGHHAERLQKQFGFRHIETITLRDDAPKLVRDAATEHLRAVVSRFGQDSRVLVLPVLISVGQIQKQIHERLAGLNYTMSEAGLAEHPLAAEWVRQQAASLASRTAASAH
jgi:sirohydrochlorin ferrochelatase